jgi:biopolymer transport protein ExbD
MQPSWAGATTPPVAARIKNIFACGSRPRRPLAHGAALTAGVLLLALSVPASVPAISSEVSNSPAAPGDAKKFGGSFVAEVRVVKVDSKHTTIIGLSQEGVISFNDRPVTLDQFIVAIQEVGKKDKDSSLLIRVDPRTPYGQLFWVLDECRKVGLIKIDFQSPSEGGRGRK